MDVWKGQRVVVCGPSGSGKSTMIRCINRLEEHQRGHIVVDGIELTNDVKNIDATRREVGMVFQHFNLFPHLTAMENLTLAPIWVRKVPKSEAEATAMKLLERVGIPEQAQVPRSAFGRSAAARRHRPRAVHVAQDHAVRRANLGARSRDDQGGARRHDRAGQEGMTMVCVTHEMGFAKSVADLMVFMDQGEIVEQSPPSEFFTNPQSDRTKLFLSQILSH